MNIPEVPFPTIGVEVRFTLKLPSQDKLADLSWPFRSLPEFPGVELRAVGLGVSPLATRSSSSFAVIADDVRVLENGYSEHSSASSLASSSRMQLRTRRLGVSGTWYVASDKATSSLAGVSSLFPDKAASVLAGMSSLFPDKAVSVLAGVSS